MEKQVKEKQMLKSQQCTVCYGMFQSNKGKHTQHTKGEKFTPKGTKQEWICFDCLEANKVK